MRTAAYHCNNPKEYPPEKSIFANFDGAVFTARCGKMQAGITAARGEEVVIKVSRRGVIECEIKSAASDGCPKRQ